jgi:nitroreductase
MPQLLLVDGQADEVEALLTTTRSVRRRLDLTRPVDINLVLRCLNIAMQAPSGGNHQIWRWVVVSDPAQRSRLGEVYKKANEAYASSLEDGLTRDNSRAMREATSTRFMTDHLGEVPVIVAACFERPPWMHLDAYGNASVYGSIFPAVWSFQLACRHAGLASCTMTSQIQRAAEVAHILGLPESFEQACVIAVAHPDRTDFAPAMRGELQSVVRIDRWLDGREPTWP